MTDPEGQTSGDDPSIRTKYEALIETVKGKDTTLAEKDQLIADLSKQVAVSGIGLDAKDPMTQFFLENYDGDMTADAMKEKASALGLIKDTGTATPPDTVTAAPVPGAVESPTAAPVMFESFTTGTEPSAAPLGLAEKIDAAARSGNQAELEQLLGANGLLAEQ